MPIQKEIRLLTLLLFLSLSTLVRAQDTIDVLNFDDDGIELIGSWRFQAGDDLNWRFIADKSDWQALESKFDIDDADGMYPGIGWFSKTCYVSDSLRGQPVAFIMNSLGGAMEIYLNGIKVGNYGKPEASVEKEEADVPWQNEVLVVKLDTSAYQRIDVRYSNHDDENSKGFTIEIDNTQEAILSFSRSMLLMGCILLFIFGGSLSFALNHLLLFFFFREEKSNLYYGLSMLFISMLTLTGLLSTITTDPASQNFYDSFYQPLVYAFPYTLLLFLYSIFYSSLRKWHIGFLIYAIVAIFLELVYDNLDYEVVHLVFIIVWFVEISRVVINAFRFKKAGSKYIGIGMLVFAIGLILFLILLLFAYLNSGQNSNGPPEIVINNIGFLALYALVSIVCILFSIPTSMSLFIGQKSAQTNRLLKQQLIKVEELSVETLRQEKEKQVILKGQKEKLEEEVARQTLDLRSQNEQINEKNKEITDSIQYAKRIQMAILPPERIVLEQLPHSFILYKPKDIVAGDFYWLESFDKVSDSEEKNVMFAAADCTGHGVPGAMVSVICVNGLNRSVREFDLRNPSEILDKTRELVIQEFEKSEEDVKDGMDISLCALNTKTNELQWAGANNPLWIVSAKSTLSTDTPFEKEPLEDNGIFLHEIKADKQPIGKYGIEQPFSQHTIQLEKGDTIYIFSDGFPDQFGGENGKKYKSMNFKKTLLELASKPIDEQKELLNSEFENWRGELEQIDDVCVIGVRI